MYSKNKIWNAWRNHRNTWQKEKAKRYVGYMLCSTYWKDVLHWQKATMKALGYSEAEWIQFK